MSAQDQLDLANLSEWLVLLAPALVVLFVGFRHILITGALGVVSAWILVNFIRYSVTNPLEEAVWALEGAPESEGDIVDNVLLLFFGWILPLLSVLIVIVFRHLWRRFHRSSHAPNVA